MIPVYVIHDSRLVERRAHIEKELNAAGLDFEWVEDYAPDEITAEVERRYYKDGHGRARPKMSCTLKHISALERMVGRASLRALVLEDDVYLCKGFKGRLASILEELDKEHGLLSVVHLSCGDNWFTPKDRLIKGKLLQPADRGRTTDGYVIGIDAARARLGWIAEKRISKSTGHTFNDADRETGVEVLWAEPHLLVQGSLSGKMPSTLSDGRSRLLTALRFYFNHYKRRYIYRWLNIS